MTTGVVIKPRFFSKTNHNRPDRKNKKPQFNSEAFHRLQRRFLKV